MCFSFAVSTGTNSIGYALERANMVAFDEMCRQLAFYTSGDRCLSTHLTNFS